MTVIKTDRRSLRTRRALRDALADEIHATGDLSKVTVTAVAERADVTRRTFYSHYRDIPSLVEAIETETIEELVPYAHAISEVTLPELEASIKDFMFCPHSPEVLTYFRERGHYLAALLGEGGDPAFVEKIKTMVRSVVEKRALEGFNPVLMQVFDYYLSYVIAAEVGVLVRWLTAGMVESDEDMARIMTALLFVRPGDLYGRPIDFDLYGIGQEMIERGKELVHG